MDKKAHTISLFLFGSVSAVHLFIWIDNLLNALTGGAILLNISISEYSETHGLSLFAGGLFIGACLLLIVFMFLRKKPLYAFLAVNFASPLLILWVLRELIYFYLPNVYYEAFNPFECFYIYFSAFSLLVTAIFGVVLWRKKLMKSFG